MIGETIHNYAGFKLVKADCLVEYVQRRKHKKRRINKKWLKRYGCKAIPSRSFYVFENSIIAHPQTMKRLVKALKCRVKENKTDGNRA